MRVLDYEIGGLSIGGIETCIDLPSLKIAFDIGRMPSAVIARPTILFTHAHMDHMGGVAIHAAMRALRKMAPPTYVIGPENAASFAALFAAWRALDRSDLPHQTIVIGPGGEHALNERLIVRPFRSVHRAPCQGYAILQRRHRLKPIYRGLPGQEIQRLVREQGVDVNEVELIPEIAFTGDSRIEVLEQEEIVRTSRLLIMECTFLDDRVSVEDCRRKGHIHLDEILARAELFENEHILLTHFSARYTSGQIQALLESRLPPSLAERVTPLLSGHRGESDPGSY
jgi:ribonuclease Z